MDELKIFDTQDRDKLSISKKLGSRYTNQLIKPENNLAFKALKLIKATYNIKKIVKIVINKQIPPSSGLGGASSDAAAVLKGLNELWKIKLSQKQLMKLAEKLGKDVPFFIIGGTALGTHFGEKIKPLKPIKSVKFKILPTEKWPKLPEKIDPKNKTEKMYGLLDLSNCGQNQKKTKTLLQAVRTQNKSGIINNIHNDFETLISAPDNAHLSGSGPAVFTAY
ncbi:hypothetical protein GF366_00460 [Candidatus Peregrinibacteria bacterium]|nr:hypothetical protein [Candidatus Peregrinibacteria bacterium]